MVRLLRQQPTLPPPNVRVPITPAHVAVLLFRPPPYLGIQLYAGDAPVALL